MSSGKVGGQPNVQHSQFKPMSGVGKGGKPMAKGNPKVSTSSPQMQRPGKPKSKESTQQLKHFSGKTHDAINRSLKTQGRAMEKLDNDKLTPKMTQQAKKEVVSSIAKGRDAICKQYNLPDDIKKGFPGSFMRMSPATAKANGISPQGLQQIRQFGNTSAFTYTVANRVNKFVSGQKDGGPKVQHQAPKTGAPKAEAPKTEAPKTEAPKTEAPKTEAPKPKAGPDKPENSALDKANKEFQQLKAQTDKISAMLGQDLDTSMELTDEDLLELGPEFADLLNEPDVELTEDEELELLMKEIQTEEQPKADAPKDGPKTWQKAEPDKSAGPQKTFLQDKTVKTETPAETPKTDAPKETPPAANRNAKLGTDENPRLGYPSLDEAAGPPSDSGVDKAIPISPAPNPNAKLGSDENPRVGDSPSGAAAGPSPSSGVDKAVPLSPGRPDPAPANQPAVTLSQQQINDMARVLAEVLLRVALPDLFGSGGMGGVGGAGPASNRDRIQAAGNAAKDVRANLDKPEVADKVRDNRGGVSRAINNFAEGMKIDGMKSLVAFLLMKIMQKFFEGLESKGGQG